MKFVIKSLLFVNLILLMTSSLRKCFDQDQNIMLTIIILAFSLIGLMGLIIGNRFILIIFSACMTLILIASITIYAINRSEPDSMQPKSPHFITNAPIDITQVDSKRPKDAQSKLKTLVNKLINRNQKPEAPKIKRLRTGQRIVNRTNQNIEETRWGSTSRSFSGGKSSPIEPLSPLLKHVQSDDYSDEITNIIPIQAIMGRAGGGGSAVRQPALAAAPDPQLSNPAKGSIEEMRLTTEGGKSPQQTPSIVAPEPQELQESADFDQVPSEQWIMYENILAAWMALLLDEDSDQCFGNKSTTKSRPPRLPKEAPVYNYNGVRYSIRPDANDSPSRVVVR